MTIVRRLRLLCTQFGELVRLHITTYYDLNSTNFSTYYNIPVLPRGVSDMFEDNYVLPGIATLYKVLCQYHRAMLPVCPTTTALPTTWGFTTLGVSTAFDDLLGTKIWHH